MMLWYNRPPVIPWELAALDASIHSAVHWCLRGFTLMVNVIGIMSNLQREKKVHLSRSTILDCFSLILNVVQD